MKCDLLTNLKYFVNCIAIENLCTKLKFPKVQMSLHLSAQYEIES